MRQSGGHRARIPTPVGNLIDSGTIAFTDVDLTDTHSIDPTITALALPICSDQAEVRAPVVRDRAFAHGGPPCRSARAAYDILAVMEALADSWCRAHHSA
jgi:hypothetical protein